MAVAWSDGKSEETSNKLAKALGREGEDFKLFQVMNYGLQASLNNISRL